MTFEWSIRGKSDERSGRRKGLGVFLDGALLFCALTFGLFIRFGVYESMMVVSGSMEPAMPVGACFLVDHRSSLHGEWQRGDVVLFDTPPGTQWAAGGDYVKRIIALPGDTIELRAGQVILNGRPLAEPYLKETPDPETQRPRQIPPGRYFVMGDNRNDSEDSRYNGTVDDGSIRGKMVLQYWPLADFGVMRRPHYSR